MRPATLIYLNFTVKDDKFMASALGYVEETLINAEIVKLLPRFLAPLVGGILSRCLCSHKTFFQTLIPATEQRIQEMSLKERGHSVPSRVGHNHLFPASLPTYPSLVYTRDIRNPNLLTYFLPI